MQPKSIAIKQIGRVNIQLRKRREHHANQKSKGKNGDEEAVIHRHNHAHCFGRRTVDLQEERRRPYKEEIREFIMRFYYPAVLFAFLGACASLTQEQCLNANWESIGYNDGARGRLESYITRHFDACTKVGITPNVEAWQAGRARGLPLYCTPNNAYNVGRAGNDLSPVCPSYQQRSLYHNWDWGQEYYLISQQISDLEDEERDIRRQIATNFVPPLTPEQSLFLANLNDRLNRIRSEINRLKDRRRRYASAPI